MATGLQIKVDTVLILYFAQSEKRLSVQTADRGSCPGFRCNADCLAVFYSLPPPAVYKAIEHEYSLNQPLLKANRQSPLR